MRVRGPPSLDQHSGALRDLRRFETLENRRRGRFPELFYSRLSRYMPQLGKARVFYTIRGSGVVRWDMSLATSRYKFLASVAARGSPAGLVTPGDRGDLA
jgi:hypothetical protein